MDLNIYQKGDFTGSTVIFCFDILNPFTNISGYLNLWDIFRFIYSQLRMTFFRKNVVAEKENFSSNAENSFSKSKVISKCKNDKP